MQPRIAELLVTLDHERAGVMHTASALPRERWSERATPDRWSVAEILWHLQRVETNISGLIAKRTAKAREEGHPSESDHSSVLGALDATEVTNRARKINAPGTVSPTEIPGSDAVVEMLEVSRELMRKTLASADGLALGSITHTHPAFGELDLYQWILFVAQHERRHAEQISETIAALVTG